MSFLHRPDTSSLLPLLRWLWILYKSNFLQSFLNTFIGLVIIGLNLFFVWCTKLSIDIATGQDSRYSLFFMGTLLVSTILLQVLFTFVKRWVRAILGVQAENRLRQQLFTQVLLSEWSGMERFHSGDVLNRMEKDVANIVLFITESFPSLIVYIVQFIGAFVFLFVMDSTLAACVIIVFPCFLIISKIYVRQMRRITRTIRQTESDIQSVIQESVQNRTVIKALRQDCMQLSNLNHIQDDLRGHVKQKTKYSSVSATFMSLGFSAGYLLAFFWGVHGLQAGIITYGSLIAFIQLVSQIQEPARNLTSYIPIFISTFTAGERLLQLMDIPREVPGKGHVPEGTPGIRISSVDYSYNREPVFDHFSYDFPPGSRTAVMGETGAGKTTLVRLMLALVCPHAGSIHIYNDSQSFPADASTRACFSFVPQGNTLFSGTIRHNLLLGNVSATSAQMKEALHYACADFVFDLPLQMDTLCGEQGFGLSEGQAQRICIARAFLQPGKILLLDEATSALDQQTEEQVLQNIQQHFADRTLIVITHRTAALAFCTNTLVLKKETNPNHE